MPSGSIKDISFVIYDTVSILMACVHKLLTLQPFFFFGAPTFKVNSE